jgi:hypothetical protein
VLFNHQPTVDGICALAEAHRPFGTTGLLPPLISDDLNVIVQVLTDIEEAIDRGVPGVLSIHIKGPFLNGEGRGVHDADKLRKLTREVVDALPASSTRSPGSSPASPVWLTRRWHTGRSGAAASWTVIIWRGFRCGLPGAAKVPTNSCS